MSGHQSRPAQPRPQTGQENRQENRKENRQENHKSADKATQENNLSTGHSDPDDGGADNARPDKSGADKH